MKSLSTRLSNSVNIAIVGPFYPLRGGIAHFGASLARALQARGHNVYAVSFSRLYPKLFFPGKSQEESAADTTAYAIYAEPLIDSLNPLSWYKAAQRIHRWQPDAVIFTHWLTFFVPCYAAMMGWLKRHSSAKIVALLHNFLPHEAHAGDGWLLRLLTRHPDGYLALSEKVKADLLQLQPRALAEVVPHPVYDLFGAAIPKAQARALLGLSETQKVMLFFGYIRRYKGLDLLLNAMPELIKTFPDIVLIIAGEFYGEESEYQARIESLGIRKHLLLATHYIPIDQVAKYFCAADCVVLPYRSATQSGIVPIAYHFERPVVVTNVGGLAEAVKDGQTGIVLTAATSQAIAEGIRAFFQKQTDFAHYIRYEKMRYSWEHFAKSLEQLVEKLQTKVP
ncbi:MAG: glycosyltransferase [Chloroherpetonaceae bacterium]|nr:glycosyltransferase [Chloroherpetonaceae bacterium]MDW8020486.1 glycosyltransferase [Chloroherpetonaceae bacterium]